MPPSQLPLTVNLGIDDLIVISRPLDEEKTQWITRSITVKDFVKEVFRIKEDHFSN